METTFIDISPEDPKERKKNPAYKEMMYRLSVHGALDFYESHTWTMKLIWAIVIATALVLAIAEIYFTFDTYVNSPILTSYAVVPQQEMEFPQIFICPMNAVNKHKIKPNQVKTVQTFFAMAATFDDENIILSKINRNYELIQQVTFRTGIPKRKHEKSIMEFFYNISIDVQEFVKECAFHRKPIACQDIVRRIFNANYGQCFLFATNITQKVPAYGMSLALDIHRDLYHPLLIPPFDGLTLCIMSTNDPGGSGEMILVKPGGWTKINLHRRRYKLINIDTGKVKQICVDAMESYEYEILNSAMKYSISSCKLDCAQRMSLKYCSCVVPLELEYLKKEYYNFTCSFDNLNECFYQTVMTDHLLEIANCSQHCITKCDYWEYTKTISTIDFNRDNFQKVGESFHDDEESYENLTYDKNRWINDTIVLDIGFSDLIHTEIIQSKSMTLDTLLGNIGGQVGLWMGVSVISVVQVFIIGMCYCLENCGQRN